MKSLRLMCAFAFLLIGCEDKIDSKVSTAPIKVGISTISESQIIHEYEFTGILIASESVRIMPMINGFVEHILFKEGSHVKIGDPLYKIDDSKISQLFKKSKADVKKYHSILENQKMNYRRFSLLYEKKYINDAEYESVKHNYEEAEADLEAKTAELNAIRRDLSYASIAAPINGKVGISTVKRGEYVEQGESIMVEIVNSKSIYIEFDVPQTTYETMTSFDDLIKQDINIDVVTSNNNTRKARLNFLDNKYNTLSNSIKLRAEIENSDGNFIPGAYARIKISIPSSKPELLIQQTAIKNIQGINSVYRIAKGVAVETKVLLGPKYKNYWILNEGLSSGDTIINEGLHLIKDGDNVISATEKSLATNP